MSQRTSSGNEVLNELGDKVMGRLQTTESNLLILGVNIFIILERTSQR
jgi:hypothetical protein